MATRSGRRLAIDATHSDAIPVLGMLECLADAKMNAGVMAETDCEVTIIGQNDLPDLLTGHPDICLRVAAAAARSYTMAVDAIKNH